MSEQRIASLNPADFIEGGLLDDADVIVKEARFALWDYNGQAKQTAALRVVFVDGEDKTHEQYYSAGDPERYVPSDDGCSLIITGTSSGLNKTSNAALFITSLVNADAKVGELLAGGNISKIDGLRAHVNRVAQQKRAGLAGSDDGKNRTILLVTKIIALPGQKPSGAKKGGAPTPAATASKAAPAAGGGDASELDGKAAGYLLQILAERGGSVAKKEVPTLVFQAANNAKDPDKAKLTTLVFKKEFLDAHPEFAVEGDTVSMAA